MATVIVDGRELQIGRDERLNGIQAAARLGIEIPHYCWHPGLSVVASCRMCLVETGKRDPATRAITMMPRVVPACQTPAVDNTVFVTDSPKVSEARAMVEEDLLIRHPIDCPICDKAGECRLQDYHFQHGQGQRRADILPFTSRRRPVGDTVTLFVDRCVMCTRCVRFTREITGTHELMVVNRGSHEEIDVVPGFPLANKLSGNVVDLCPVGALGDTDFLYSQRVWFMKSHAGVCAKCSTGCSIDIEENQDHVYRLKPRENPFINQWWMCDEGRYGFKHVHDPRRVTSPRRLGDQGYENVEWSDLPRELHGKLKAAGHVAAVISPHVTVEEAYLLGTYLRGLDPEAVLAIGPIPVEGDEEVFPNGFTIHAEKCPNRKGVEAVVSRLTGDVVTFEQFLDRLNEEEFGAVWVAGGYPVPTWIDEADAARLVEVPLLIVQDMFPSPVWMKAHYQLPSAAFPERYGSYVNFADRLQSFDWAIRPPAGVMVEGQVYWRLQARPGLYRPEIVLAECAGEIPYFSAAVGAIPANGLELRVNQLAVAT
jgi:NADH-quinone oxidoreductase subunit G